MARTTVTGAQVRDGEIQTIDIANLAVTSAKIANGAVTDAQVAAANKDGAATIPSLRTLGTGAAQASAGNHAHSFAEITAKPTTIAGYGITDAVSTSLGYYIGTTLNTLNRASGAQTLSGVSVDGNAATSDRTNIWASVFGRLNEVSLGSGISTMLGVHTNGDAYKFNALGVQTWLGLKSNAYSDVAYLPLAGGNLSGALGVNGNIEMTNGWFIARPGSRVGIGGLPNLSGNPLQVHGGFDMNNGNITFMKDGAASNVMYTGGLETFILRNFGTEPSTLFEVRSKAGNPLTDIREATIALTRTDDAGNDEFLDIYNNGYHTGLPPSLQHGIRIQKRGTGLYRPFVFDWFDGTTFTPGYKMDAATGFTFYKNIVVEGASITASGSTSVNWNSAYSWGNHAGLYAPTSGSGNYIQNQTAVAQSANIRISGSGTFNAGLSSGGLITSNSGYNGVLDLNYNTGITGGLAYWAGGTVSKFSVNNTGAATFASTVTAPTFIGALNGNANTATNSTKWNGYNIAAVMYASGSFQLPVWNSTNQRFEFSEAPNIKSWLGAPDGTTLTGNVLSLNNIKLIDLSNNNPSTGPLNTNWAAIRGSGRSLYRDEEFVRGSNDVTVYNNAGGTGVVLTREASTTAPNASGFVIKISVDGVGGTSPGLGGFIQSIFARTNGKFVQIFRAKIPAGYTLNIHENSQGTGSTSYWATNNVGTGKWEEYTRVSLSGDTGPFSSGGHVGLSGPAGAVIWYLASCNVYDITATDYATEVGNIANTVVLRDGSGGFSAGTITANSLTATNIGVNGVLYLDKPNSGTNTYHQLNRNAITTENMFLWRTANVDKWYLGQRSKGNEDGFSLFSTNVNEDAMYFNPNGNVNFRNDVSAKFYYGSGVGLTGTANGLSIGGNAATASNSTQWNGMTYTGSTTFTDPEYIMTYDIALNTWKPATDGTIRSFLGLGSNAYNSTAYLPLAGGTLSGNLLFSNSGLTKRGIQGTNGDNDYWFIGGGATATNAGFLEIATGDDGQGTAAEPIYVSQYGPGDPLTGTLIRRAKLLDEKGSTSFPGDLSIGTALSSSSLIMGDSDQGERYLHCNSNRIGFLTQERGWGAWCEDNGNWVCETDMRAANFYGNFRGNLVGLNAIYSTTVGTGYNQAVQMREVNGAGAQGSNMIYAPRLAFHWADVVASSIVMEASGRIAIVNNPGTGYEDFIAKNIFAASFFASSDIRLKNVIKKDYNATEVKSISYTWKDKSKGEKIQVGYSAQEVQKYMPDAVNIDSEGMLSVNYIQVLVAKVATLEKQLKQLQNAN